MILFALLLRLAIPVGIILLIYYALKGFFGDNDPHFVRCGRCEGKGFWYAARGRETCDWCKGSGKLPRQMDDM